MSSTNKTANYELSQFLGTDKPAWLADYNSDMSKIDTQMKANADGVTSASGVGTANTNAIGTLANLTTEAKTNLVSAINEVDAGVTTAQNTANSASSSASTANTNIAKFNLTSKSTLTSTTNLGTIDTSISAVQFATDTSASVFKVYGRLYITGLSNVSGTINIKLGDTSLRPTTAYSINTGAIVCRVYGNPSTFSDTTPRNITVNTDGSITMTDTLNGSIETYSIMLPPCLYFNSDFGDI